MTRAGIFCIIILDENMAERSFLNTNFSQYEQTNKLHQGVNSGNEKSNLANQKRSQELHFFGNRHKYCRCPFSWSLGPYFYSWLPVFNQ